MDQRCGSVSRNPPASDVHVPPIPIVGTQVWSERGLEAGKLGESRGRHGGVHMAVAAQFPHGAPATTRKLRDSRTLTSDILMGIDGSD